MKMEQVREIANAVLYEGYLLYPYRQSAIKNRQRWTIGVVYPQEYSQANGGFEPWIMQTECLLRAEQDATLNLSIRFLHLLVCSVQHTAGAQSAANANGAAGVQSAADIPSAENANSADPDRATFSSTADPWSIVNRFADEPREEGIEREISVHALSLRDLLLEPRTLDFAFPAASLPDEAVPASPTPLVRAQQALHGSITIAAKRVAPPFCQLTVRITNLTPATGFIPILRNAIMQHSFISTHTILAIQQGTFVSLLDPPEEARAAAQDCENLHTWPVLIGDEGDLNTLLSSPIILYDYPQLAPESPGSLFDGTEIDEILTLRIMTLTDEEKAEMRQGDARVRQILERTENLTAEDLMKLHGTIRSMKPLTDEEI
ncbi:MAG TPA: hypothetical protein VGD98_09160 [Ktedonobacteraceae bacterium]